MINLYVEPRIVLSWNEFLSQKPNYSVALDGYVSDATKRDPNKMIANFDHHSVVDRLSTRSTTEQIFMEINLGLFEMFRQNGQPHMNIFVNDCDEDTVLSIWLLQNNERVVHHADPLINKLVSCLDKLDCTGGVYPFGDTTMLRKMAWMFQPYKEARKQGKLFTLNSEEMKTIIEACLSRISLYTQGMAQEIELDGTYKIIGGGPEWSLIKESGTSSRMKLFASGLKTIVSVLDSGKYVIMKKSMWVKFPLEALFNKLNQLEGAMVWGGSNTIGGSLRSIPSKFSPQELEEIINKFLKEKQ